MFRSPVKVLLIAALLKAQLISCQSGNSLSNENIIFHRITTEQGLASDIIHCIIQDSKGFIWVGTDNGLCRYDGSRFTTYRNNQTDSFSISNNDVVSIAQDGKGRIWAGTYWEGLNLLDNESRRFIRFKNNKRTPSLFSNNTIYDINPLDDTHLAIAQGELLILDTKKRQSNFIQLPKNIWSDRNTYANSAKFSASKIFVDREKKWWLFGELGAVQYDPLNKKINLLCTDAGIPEVFKNTSTWDCKEDSKGNIWIAAGSGLFEYERASATMIQHYPSRFLSKDVKSPFVKSIICASDGSIWFGTNNGLFHYDPVSRKYQFYRNNSRQAYSISNDDIQCLYEDKQHIIWVGTINGLNAIYPQISAFKTYQGVADDPRTIQSNFVKAAFKDDEGNIWIGTGMGLECIDQVTGKTSHYQIWDNRLKSQIEYFVMPILQENDHSFWVGTWGTGMQLFDFKKRKFIASYIHTESDSTSICSNFIHSFCKDNSGNLWIATWNGGIDKFNIRRKSFEHFNTSNRRSGVNSDFLNKTCFAYGTIWVGGTHGLLKYDSSQNKFFSIKTVNSGNSRDNAQADIAADGKGNLWLSSFIGLIKYNINSNQVEKNSAVRDLPIFGIYVEADEKIWLASAEGLKLFNPATQKMISYSLKDGLPISYFPVETYFYRSKDGELFISSNAGLVHFYPDKIIQNETKPPLIITSVKIENKEVENIGDFSVLKQLGLQYDQDYLSISFAALNFINPSQNQYAYKLEGLDKTWVYAGNRNEIVYPKLPSGHYILKVKASNDAGVWNEEGIISLPIHISTPWWKTWWFYTLCFIAIITSGYSLYRFRINGILAEQKLRNKIARDLHDDIGSTLSGIKLFSRMAQKKLQEEKSSAQDIVERIGDRSEKMMEAMSDIVWSINPVNDSIEKMLVRMKQYAAEMMDSTNIEYSFTVDEKMIRTKISSEARKDIYLIFKESINNAIKHSQCSQIFIELNLKGKNLEMFVRDNGNGFDARLNGSGNGLSNFLQRAKDLGGEIQISSKERVGTIVRLTIPVT